MFPGFQNSSITQLETFPRQDVNPSSSSKRLSMGSVLHQKKPIRASPVSTPEVYGSDQDKQHSEEGNVLDNNSHFLCHCDGASASQAASWWLHLHK